MFWALRRKLSPDAANAKYFHEKKTRKASGEMKMKIAMLCTGKQHTHTHTHTHKQSHSNTHTHTCGVDKLHGKCCVIELATSRGSYFNSLVISSELLNTLSHRD